MDIQPSLQDAAVLGAGLVVGIGGAACTVFWVCAALVGLYKAAADA